MERDPLGPEANYTPEPLDTGLLGRKGHNKATDHRHGDGLRGNVRGAGHGGDLVVRGRCFRGAAPAKGATG